MPPPTRAEIQDAIEHLSERSIANAREDAARAQQLDQVVKLAGLLRLALAGIVAVTAWVVWVQFQLGALSKEVEARSVMIQRVNEMWWMKEHGISNKEDFQRRNGYSAPGAP